MTVTRNIVPCGKSNAHAGAWIVASSAVPSGCAPPSTKPRGSGSDQRTDPRHFAGDRRELQEERRGKDRNGFSEPGSRRKRRGSPGRRLFVPAKAVEKVAVLESMLIEDVAHDAAIDQQLADVDGLGARQSEVAGEPVHRLAADEALPVHGQQVATVDD